jgi:hypothetical protein
LVHFYTTGDTWVNADAYIYDGCEGPKVDFAAHIVSDRAVDTVEQSDRNVNTDRDGMVYASVSTTDQTSSLGHSVLSVQEVETENTNPASVQWLPAPWDSEFKITCYNTPVDTEYTKGADAKDWEWCGWVIPPSNVFKQRFYEEVQENGTGIIHVDGVEKWIDWDLDNACVHWGYCAMTSSMVCARIGITVARDYQTQRGHDAKVPFLSSLHVDTLGDVHVEDNGGIYKYHLDVYMGIGENVCKGLSWLGMRRVTMLSY